MREYQVFLRGTYARDIVNDGTLVDWVDTLEAHMQQPFAQWLPLGRSPKPLSWNAMARLEELDGRIGQGLNQQVRMRLIAASNPAGIVHFDIQATMHPYTGRYVAACELRLENDALKEAGAVELWADQLQKWVASGGALSAHMHQADDDAIQNVSSPGVLRLGYGIDVDSIDLANNPGRETSRGEHRYVVNWLSFFGKEMMDELQWPELNVEGLRTWKENDGLWWRLSDTPLEPDAPETRQRQMHVREQLGIQALADRKQRAFGFWQKK